MLYVHHLERTVLLYHLCDIMRCHTHINKNILFTDLTLFILFYWFHYADIPDTGLLCDLLWADPDKDIVGWGENDRGVSFTFGEDVVAQFLRRYVRYLVCKLAEGAVIFCVSAYWFVFCTSILTEFKFDFLTFFFTLYLTLSRTISQSLSVSLSLLLPFSHLFFLFDCRIWLYPHSDLHPSLLSFNISFSFFLLTSLHCLCDTFLWIQTRFRSYLSGTSSSGRWVRVLRSKAVGNNIQCT